MTRATGPTIAVLAEPPRDRIAQKMLAAAQVTMAAVLGAAVALGEAAAQEMAAAQVTKAAVLGGAEAAATLCQSQRLLEISLRRPGQA